MGFTHFRKLSKDWYWQAIFSEKTAIADFLDRKMHRLKAGVKRCEKETKENVHQQLLHNNTSYSNI